MSQFIQHPASSIRLSFAARRAAWLLALAALLAIAAVAVILLVSNDNSSSSSATSGAPVSTSVPDARYDGGPEEGTAGLTAVSPVTAIDNNSQRPYHAGGGFTERHDGGFSQRYDGGPEEGSAVR
jgi:hypothetical protein